MTQALTDIQWEKRTARIEGEQGLVFEQTDVEVPNTWSQLALNVVASKYFRGQLHSPQRETSVNQLIRRVVDTLHTWSIHDNYFGLFEQAQQWDDTLTSLLLHQQVAFNSPVFFNVGVHPQPQASACFILSVDDTMESILEWIRQEGIIFKGGSGSGVNISRLRARDEPLSKGGKASGPLSFMKVADVNAGAIKSGGTTRRAAKLICMDVDHPDIHEFVTCKVDEERKAQALIAAGFSNGIEGEAYTSVAYQNANHSVRVSDAFMLAVMGHDQWSTLQRTTGNVVQTFPARDVFTKIATAAWTCGDPGIQFDDTMNEWHTCANTDRIYGSNPCGEFVFLNNTACNLASINLLSFLKDDGTFDVLKFCEAVDILITAMDILVDRASYPTAQIAENSWRFRPLGLGYANLGALLMTLGFPYDSDEGRTYAASLTALMTGRAYRRSAELAQLKGAFEGYESNRDSMLRVIRQHIASLNTLVPTMFTDALHLAWSDALMIGSQQGFRNAQVTLLAPTGTIAFMMDCVTTGVEPATALVVNKALVGGGSMRIVNTAVPQALRNLGYGEELVHDIEWYVNDHGTVEGCRDLDQNHLPIFDCALPGVVNGRSIHWEGHVRMVGAVQPFLSGSVSKTINMPSTCTVQDIEKAYVMAWEQGLKSITVYRDGCKQAQPLSVLKPQTSLERVEVRRQRLPDERPAITHKFNIAGYEGYFTVGLYEGGKPGELFITMAKEGSTISGLLDTIGVLTSLLLQYGVPLSVMCTKLCGSNFQPAGFTTNPQLPIAKSVVDYIFRWLMAKFGDHVPEVTISVQAGALSSISGEMTHVYTDAPVCPECGTLMASRNGTCFGCLNCGATNGCS